MDENTSISRTATLAGFTAAVATTHGVHLRDLAPMTTLHVHTRNSMYRIIVSSGDAVLVEVTSPVRDISTAGSGSTRVH